MLVLILLISVGALFGSTNANKVVTCYYDASSSYWHGYNKVTDSWDDEANRYQVKNIDTTHCTHLIYAFAKLGADYKIAAGDAWLDLDTGIGNYKAFTNKKSSKTKTLLAIGGAKDSKKRKDGKIIGEETEDGKIITGTSKYSELVADPDLREKFITHVIKFLTDNNFQGLDLDWEFPANTEYGGRAADKNNFATFVKEIRAAFNEDGSGLLLTAAVGKPGDKGYDYSSLYGNLDFVHIMTYDFNGWWEGYSTSSNTKAKHNSPMSNTKALIKDWIDNISCKTKDKISLCPSAACSDSSKVCPRNKLVLGVALYGRSFELKNSLINTPNAAVSGPGKAGTYPEEKGLLSYLDICKSILKKGKKGWKKVGRSGDEGTYAYHDNQWVGYDDKTMAEEKAQYAKKEGLGGVMVWSIDYADWNNKCKGGKYPLLTAMSAKLK